MRSERPAGPSGDTQRQIRVLLVDDEEAFVDTLAMRLRMRRFIVSTVYDGEEALILIGDDMPDVIVLDLKLPGMQGMDVLREVQKQYPGLPVIMLTGHGSDRDAEEAKACGACELLKKPVEIDTLVDHILEAYMDCLERHVGTDEEGRSQPPV